MESPGRSAADTDDEQSKDVQFEAFVSAVKDYAIFALDPQGNIVTWNEGARRIKGYSEAEIVGEHFSTLYTEDDIAEGIPDRNLEKATSEGRVEDEGWRVRADGSHFWANVTITAIRDDEGDLQGFTKVTRDMTERREYERQLEVKAERLERQRADLQEELDDIFDRIDDAFFALDDELRFNHINEKAESFLDATAAEFIGRKVSEVTFAAADPLTKDLKTALATQEQMTFERYLDSLGIWARFRIYPSESGLSVYFEDISARRERERKLKESERLYRALVENYPQGTVALVDPDLRYQVVGGSPIEVDVDSPEDLEGKKVPDALSEELSEEVVPRYEAALHGESSRFEYEQNGHHYTIQIFPIRADDEEIFGAMGMAQDITEQIQREQQLEELVDRLEESNERLEQFAYAASHDLQEPLRMISSYLQLLEQRHADELGEDGREFVDFAVNGADRMRNMIEGLLEYSRVESQGDPFEPIDLGTILTEVREDLRVKIEESGADITADELPRVNGDSSQLRQVFLNLLKNAIEYSGDELPRVHVSAQRDDNNWIVSVRDEGIGIDPDDRERIFEVFERLHSRDEHGGTGIGLALCERIIERHGGKLWVESEPGEGSTFSFTLPVVD